MYRVAPREVPAIVGKGHVIDGDRNILEKLLGETGPLHSYLRMEAKALPSRKT
jgi:hypothetical protein